MGQDAVPSGSSKTSLVSAERPGAVSWNSVTKPLQSNSKRIRLNI